MRIERLARIRFRYRSPHIPFEVVSFRFEVSSVLGLSALNESSASFSGALKMNEDERTYTDSSFNVATALLNVSYTLLRRPNPYFVFEFDVQVLNIHTNRQRKKRSPRNDDLQTLCKTRLDDKGELQSKI